MAPGGICANGVQAQRAGGLRTHRDQASLSVNQDVAATQGEVATRRFVDDPARHDADLLGGETGSVGPDIQRTLVGCDDFTLPGDADGGACHGVEAGVACGVGGDLALVGDPEGVAVVRVRADGADGKRAAQRNGGGLRGRCRVGPGEDDAAQSLDFDGSALHVKLASRAGLGGLGDQTAGFEADAAVARRVAGADQQIAAAKVADDLPPVADGKCGVLCRVRRGGFDGEVAVHRGTQVGGCTLPGGGQAVAEDDAGACAVNQDAFAAQGEVARGGLFDHAPRGDVGLMRGVAGALPHQQIAGVGGADPALGGDEDGRARLGVEVDVADLLPEHLAEVGDGE